jgi:excisionase family DNA binding protein
MLSIEEAATALSVHPQTVRKLIKRGELAAIKVARHWRVSENVLTEFATAAKPETPTAKTNGAAPDASAHAAPSDAETIWREMISGNAQRHNDALRTLFAAPDEVRAIITRRSADAAAAYYATPEGDAELADWRATSDPVQDDAGDYFTDEEEAQFRAQKAQGAAR